MNFAEFAKLYGFLRIRTNRADDLNVDVKSELDETILANDDESFRVRLFKRSNTLAIRLQNDGRGTVLHAQAKPSLQEVTVLEQTIDVFTLLDMFESENLNGLETMAYYESQNKRVDPLAEYKETQQYAEKAARLIVAGIGETPELTPEDQAMVANEIIAILKDPAPFGFAARVQRTITWAMRPQTQPEWGFYVASWVMRTYPEHVEIPHAEVFAHFSPVGQHVSQ